MIWIEAGYINSTFFLFIIYYVLFIICSAFCFWTQPTDRRQLLLIMHSYGVQHFDFVVEMIHFRVPSLEEPTLDRSYLSYPPAFVLWPYLIAKLRGRGPELEDINAIGSASQLVSAFCMALLVYLIAGICGGGISHLRVFDKTCGQRLASLRGWHGD